MTRVTRGCSVCLFVALSLCVANATFSQESAPRAAVPSKDAQAESLKLVREVFADDRANAKTSQQKSELAKKLLKQAGESQQGSANQFVLLRVAYDLAISAGDATTTSTAIDEVTTAFKIEPAALRVAAGQKLQANARSSTQRKALGKIAAQWAGEALAADDYKTAQSMISTALSMARLVRDIRLVRSLANEQKDVAAAAMAYAAAEVALKTLRDKPTDPTANLEAGRYYCFVKHDWDIGIAMLALGGESELVKVARMDLATKPGDATLIALADAWWTLGDKEAEGRVKDALLTRAGSWYQQALPTQQGLTRARTEKRLAEVKHLLAGADPVIVAVKPDPPERPTRQPSGDFPGITMLKKSKAARVELSGAVAKLGPWPKPAEADPADAKQQALFKFNTLLHENYQVTPMIKHTGDLRFKVLSDGVVVAAVSQNYAGDRRLSGGSWKSEVQSREKLMQLGWKPLGIELQGGELLLLARQCKAGEQLFLRTRKYHTPRVFVPKSGIAIAGEPPKPGTTPPPTADTIVIDDGDASFSAPGWYWRGAGYGGGEHFQIIGRRRADVATWSFTVRPGKYQVSAYWRGLAAINTDSAEFSISGGDKGPFTVTVDQRKAPQGGPKDPDEGKVFQNLGSVINVRGTTIKVVLSPKLERAPGDATGEKSTPMADAVMVTPVGATSPTSQSAKSSVPIELIRCPNCHKHKVPRPKDTEIRCPKCRRIIPAKF